MPVTIAISPLVTAQIPLPAIVVHIPLLEHDKSSFQMLIHSFGWHDAILVFPLCGVRNDAWQ